MATDKEHLQWIHDRIIKVYRESENVDFLIRMRKIIDNNNVVGQSEQLKAFFQEIENDKIYIHNQYFKNKAKTLRERL